MDSLHFAHPYWLPVGLFCCLVLAWLLKRLQSRRQEKLARFAGAQLLARLTRNVSTGRRRIKTILLLAAIMLLFVALAQPRYGFTWTEVKRKGIDILFALDTSNSMLAEDTRPNRLQRARLGIMDFVAKLEGDRVGLLPFAGTSYLMCPLTLDYDAFTTTLATVTTEIIPKGGTNISAVIQEAERVLDNDANHKILVLLTDGENLEGDVLESARAAGEKGMTIFTVGVGTPGGELIPLAGESGFVKDPAGKYVTSKLDEETLAAIAEATGGLYAPLGNSGQGLETIYQQKLTLIPKEELMERRQKQPVERFIWPLAAALVLLLVEYLLPEQKLGKTLSLWPRKPPVAGKTPLTILLFLIVAGCVLPRPGLGSPAEEAYAAGDFLQASEMYRKRLDKHPDDPALNYNYGTTAYKNNLHDEAIAAFTKALKSDDLDLQAKAYYNRGNALYQKGAESRQADPKQTIDTWQEALTSYEATLKLNPDDRQAGENMAFVRRELEQLKEQMEQQDQNKQQNDSQNSDDSQNNEQHDPQQDQNQDQKQQEKQDGSGSQDDSNNHDNQQENDQDQAPKREDGKDDQQPQPAQPQPEQNDVDADQQDQQQDQARQALGQMTREEAENLLEALKNEEGELNFVPRGQDSTVGRDW